MIATETEQEQLRFGLTATCIADIRRVFSRSPRLEKAVLFGSRAMGTYKNGSDIDLALLGDALTHADVITLYGQLDELPYAYTYDLIDYNKISNPAVKAHIDDLGITFYEREKRLLPTGWADYRLEDALEKLIDYRGKTPTKSNFGIPLITAKVVKDGRIETPNEFIAEEDYLDWMRRGIPEYGDVVLTTEAPLGEVAQIKTNEKIALAQRIITLRGKKGVLDNAFLKYFLLSPIGQNNLKSKESGSTVTGIKQSELRQVSIYAPESIQTQQEIASILSAFDDKIELNRRMSQTLEAIAQTLFTDWFVRFNFPGFDGELVDGLPKGWQMGTLGEVVNVKGGGTPSTSEPSFWNGDFAWVTPKDLSSLASPVLLCTERSITAQGVKQISSGILPKGTLLLSSRAPIGYMVLSQIPVSINQGFIAIQGETVSNTWMLFWLKQNMNAVKSRANGSTFQEISKSNFKEIGVIIPDEDRVRSFDRVVNPMLEKIAKNETENQTLTQLRDSLLPKLMSGQIPVGASPGGA